MSFWEEYLKQKTDFEAKKMVTLANQDYFEFNGKRYDYRKVNLKEHRELVRAFNAARKQEDQEELNDAIINAYVKRAEYFLGMTSDEYYAIPWTDSRDVLDACMYRASQGKPDFLGSLATLQGSTDQSSPQPPSSSSSSTATSS